VEAINNDGVLCVPLRQCANCGASGDVLYEQLEDSDFSAPGKWSLRQCPSCKLAWADPQPLPGEISKLYHVYYTHGEGGDADSNAYDTRGIKKIIKRVLSMVFFWRGALYMSGFHYLETLRPGRLLEVGCGNGGFLRAAASRGWEAVGLDFDHNAVRQANSIPGVSARVQELSEANYPPNSFDAIVMNNVIEHIWNPVETLSKCRELLRCGGRLVMITPNISSMGHRIFGRYWRGLEPPRHLFLYDARPLRSLCQRVGFRRIVAGTSAGGTFCMPMLLASAARAGAENHLKPEAMRRVAVLEYITTMLGGMRGEWLVLIATV
jgi:2-polyprenyl-3-methyl-5-hydroxy-6-metoxy-1,4-benzoquinol methylase